MAETDGKKIIALAKKKDLNFAAVLDGKSVEVCADPMAQPKSLAGELKKAFKKSKPIARGVIGPDGGGIVFKLELEKPGFEKQAKAFLKKSGAASLQFRVQSENGGDGGQPAADEGEAPINDLDNDQRERFDDDDNDDDDDDDNDNDRDVFKDAKGGKVELWSRNVGGALKDKLGEYGRFLEIGEQGSISLTVNGELMAVFETAKDDPVRGNIIDACNLIFDKLIDASVKDFPDVDKLTAELSAHASLQGLDQAGEDAYVRQELEKRIAEAVKKKALPNLQTRAKAVNQKIEEVATKHFVRLVRQDALLAEKSRAAKIFIRARYVAPAFGFVVAGVGMITGAAAATGASAGAAGPPAVGATFAGIAMLRSASSLVKNVREKTASVEQICADAGKELEALIERYKGKQDQTARARTAINSVLAQDILATHSTVAKSLSRLEKPLAAIEKTRAIRRKAVQTSLEDIDRKVKELAVTGLPENEIERLPKVKAARSDIRKLLDSVHNEAKESKPLFDTYSSLQDLMAELGQSVKLNDGGERAIAVAVEGVALLVNLGAGLGAVGGAMDAAIVLAGQAADTASTLEAEAGT